MEAGAAILDAVPSHPHSHDGNVTKKRPTRHGVPELSERSARRVVREMSGYLGSYDPPLEKLDVPSQAVAHVLWGWWRWVIEQGLVVVEAKSPRRVAAVSPLVRSVGEHADLMVWLAATRDEGLQALHRQREQWQRQLWEDYEDAVGHGPAETPKPVGPAPPASATARRLDQELKDIQQRIGSFDGMVPYYVYRSTSDRVHANLGTARAYAPVDEDGIGRLNPGPDPESIETYRAAAVLDVALRCCQAAMVFKREVRDPGLDDQVSAWLGVLGIQDALPTRRQTAAEPPAVNVERLAGEAVTKVQRMQPDLIALSKHGHQCGTELASGIRRLISALDKLSNLLAPVEGSKS